MGPCSFHGDCGVSGHPLGRHRGAHGVTITAGTRWPCHPPWPQLRPQGTATAPARLREAPDAKGTFTARNKPRAPPRGRKCLSRHRTLMGWHRGHRGTWGSRRSRPLPSRLLENGINRGIPEYLGSVPLAVGSAGLQEPRTARAGTEGPMGWMEGSVLPGGCSR